MADAAGYGLDQLHSYLLDGWQGATNAIGRVDRALDGSRDGGTERGLPFFRSTGSGAGCVVLVVVGWGHEGCRPQSN